MLLTPSGVPVSHDRYEGPSRGWRSPESLAKKHCKWDGRGNHEERRAAASGPPGYLRRARRVVEAYERGGDGSRWEKGSTHDTRCTRRRSKGRDYRPPEPSSLAAAIAMTITATAMSHSGIRERTSHVLPGTTIALPLSSARRRLNHGARPERGDHGFRDSWWTHTREEQASTRHTCAIRARE